MSPPDASGLDALAARLRAAGSVFAEEEAAILAEAATGDTGLEELVQRRIDGEPIEPLVGWVRFGRLRLEVGPGVFVPRQRSLRLARLAVRRARERAAGEAGGPVVLEAYCGVAPLAATVAAFVPDAEVHAADSDDAALAYARRNLPAAAGVHRSDALDGLPPGLVGRVDVIAAVPPYVPESEFALLPREARDFEPPTALVGGGDDGLGHFQRLLHGARRLTRPGGFVLIELHDAQLPIAAAEAGDAGWRRRIHRPSDARTGVLELVAG